MENIQTFTTVEYKHLDFCERNPKIFTFIPEKNKHIDLLQWNRNYRLLLQWNTNIQTFTSEKYKNKDFYYSENQTIDF